MKRYVASCFMSRSSVDSKKRSCTYAGINPPKHDRLFFVPMEGRDCPRAQSATVCRRSNASSLMPSKVMACPPDVACLLQLSSVLLCSPMQVLADPPWSIRWYAVLPLVLTSSQWTICGCRDMTENISSAMLVPSAQHKRSRGRR